MLAHSQASRFAIRANGLQALICEEMARRQRRFLRVAAPLRARGTGPLAFPLAILSVRHDMLLRLSPPRPARIVTLEAPLGCRVGPVLR